MRKSFLLAIVICVVMLAAVLFMVSPYFTVTDIQVTGCESISERDILAQAGLEKTLEQATNLFLINASAVKKSIKQNLYIESVTVTKNFPNTLTIAIRERHLSGYVEYMQGKYLYIDENGRVLEINSFFTQKFPIVKGLKFDKIRLGELLDVDDATAFKTLVTYTKLLIKYQLTDLVTYINVSDNENTRMQIYHIDVQLGDIQNADEKIRTMVAAIEALPEAKNVRGILYLTDVQSGRYTLRLMT